MCVFLISPVPIAEPLTSELIDTPVFYNLAPRPIKYWVSVPIPMYNNVNLLSPQNNSTQPLMSKPLATKVSTPLSENAQIGPN